MTIRQRIPSDNLALSELWLRSVRATHTFLGEADIQALYPQVRDLYLPAVQVWVEENPDGRPAGFIGIDQDKVEMLFIEPEQRGQGIGTRLLDFVRQRCGPLSVDVNEQNPEAHGFYRHYGFHDTGRSETDGQGQPFPLIHMALAPSSNR
ncbi:GNAT family N-acetyltransferase [Pseudomonas vanderleydeniana]|uniref:GNAT family N-acetyltransferase n=1 Tax=Pseudomonas vanderleydeniana TaxID=2745495 RepID=A0A9E6TPJ1_9PSED|nr:GNAT family N-acetyltransferase [Pseudomonas vanderleydeniana]QXI26473.1 GNAT family N-acetyltransferase [Pseudomonas vanderleydeniana]